jgi:hypothetical protein
MAGRISGLSGMALFFLCFDPIDACAAARLIMGLLPPGEPDPPAYYYLDTIRYFPLFLLRPA